MCSIHGAHSSAAPPLVVAVTIASLDQDARLYLAPHRPGAVAERTRSSLCPRRWFRKAICRPYYAPAKEPAYQALHCRCRVVLTRRSAKVSLEAPELSLTLLERS